jgi:tRNA-specific 2-thiouridylase
LHVAADAARDQSYFLYTTTKEQLDFVRFPLGDFTKPEIRAMAAELGLNVASKPDSQDICFVPSGDYAAVVARLRPEAHEAGDIVNLQGDVLGRHEGIIHYTVGQRRGLNLHQRAGENNEPLYVVRLEAEKRQVIVGPAAALGSQQVFIRELNWLAAPIPAAGLAVQAKLRSTMAPVAARIFAAEGNKAQLLLDTPAQGIAPGQAAVLYDGTRLLGGGWITRYPAKMADLPQTLVAAA